MKAPFTRVAILIVVLLMTLVVIISQQDSAGSEEQVIAETTSTPTTSAPTTTTIDVVALGAFFDAVAASQTTTTTTTAPPTTTTAPAPPTTAHVHRAAPVPAPPTVPVPPAPPAAPAPAPIGSIESIIRSAATEFGVSGDLMVRIARCESTMNPLAVNPSSGALGLFQHLPQYWGARAAALGYGYADWSNPTANSRVSAVLMRDGGAGHWSCA